MRCGGGKCIVENSRQKCFCNTGYHKGPADLDECVNINECALRERNKCNATKCQDVDGSYKCVCTAGYALTPDGLACRGMFSTYLPNSNTVEHEIHTCPKYSEFGSFAS